MIDFLKQKPLTSAAAAITSIGTILGAIWAFDSHYASAADLQAVQKNFSSQVIQMQVNDYDDKIFALTMKKNAQNGKLNPAEAALLDRYQRKQDELQNQLKDLNTSK